MQAKAAILFGLATCWWFSLGTFYTPKHINQDDIKIVKRLAQVNPALGIDDLLRIKDKVFDWERMLAFEGNTSPYLQYAHARICSIFRKTGVDRASVRGITPIVDHNAERALTMRLLQFDTAVWDTLDKYSPHRLCTYLFELASEFSSFYEHCPVMRADSDEQKMSRLALCDFTARVMEQGLALLGIESPEQM
jgi:arginyl-tRNA synthetase